MWFLLYNIYSIFLDGCLVSFVMGEMKLFYCLCWVYFIYIVIVNLVEMLGVMIFE